MSTSVNEERFFPLIDQPPIDFDPSIDAPPQNPAVDADDDEFVRAESKGYSCFSMRCFGWSSLATQVFVFSLFMLNIFVCKYIENNTYLTNTTVYTQALDDWSKQPWVDFVWHPNGDCPADYEPIHALWPGTHDGNLTTWTIPPLVKVEDDSRYDHDVDRVPPKVQTSIFTDMQDALCGKRGGTAFADIFQATKDGDDFECPDNMIPCTDDTESYGSPNCVLSKDDCPITELILLDASNLSKSQLSLDTRFKVKQSSPGTHQTHVAFTKDGVNTNVPLQSMRWAAGQPCAFTNQKDVYDNDNYPVYY